MVSEQVYINLLVDYKSVYVDIFMILCISTKMVADSYMTWRFTQAFRFFVNKKRKLAGGLSPYNILVIRGVQALLICHIIVIAIDVPFMLMITSFMKAYPKALLLIRFLVQPFSNTLIFIIF